MLNLLKFVANHPLNANNKIKALLRFIRWQASTLLNKYPIIYPFTERSKLIVWKGLTGATQNVYCGLHEFHDMGFLLHFLRPNDLFVDVGANIGSYTILASAEVGANTIAVEPIPTTFRNLKNNVFINNIQDLVTMLNIGLGSQIGRILFTKGGDTLNHVAISNEIDTIEVDIDTLDNILAHQQPTLLKIDVEGFETEVLKGAEMILRQDRLQAIIIELNGSGSRYGYDEQYIHNLLITAGFIACQYNPFSRVLSKIGTYGHHNTIYIRNFDNVTSRLMSARKFRIHGKEL